MQATFGAKVREASLTPVLDAIAELCGRAERCLYVDRRVRRRPLKAIKREYLVRFGLTARQFNAVEVMLCGKAEGAHASQCRQVKILERQVQATK